MTKNTRVMNIAFFATVLLCTIMISDQCKAYEVLDPKGLLAQHEAFWPPAALTEAFTCGDGLKMLTTFEKCTIEKCTIGRLDEKSKCTYSFTPPSSESLAKWLWRPLACTESSVVLLNPFFSLNITADLYKQQGSSLARSLLHQLGAFFEPIFAIEVVELRTVSYQFTENGSQENRLGEEIVFVLYSRENGPGSKISMVLDRHEKGFRQVIYVSTPLQNEYMFRKKGVTGEIQRPHP